MTQRQPKPARAAVDAAAELVVKQGGVIHEDAMFDAAEMAVDGCTKESIAERIKSEAAEAFQPGRTCCWPAPHTSLTSLFICSMRAAVRHRLQDLHRRRLRVGAEERQPAVLLLDQHHPDHAAGRPPRRQERLDRLGHLLAVLHALHLLPAALSARHAWPG